MHKLLSKRSMLHEEVAEILRREVILPAQAGVKLEGERTLAVRFGVSVGTIREALRSLAQEGLLRRRHGSGTFVSDRLGIQHVAIVIELEVSHPRASRFHLRVGQELKDYLAAQGISGRLYLGRTVPGSSSLEVTCPEFHQDLAAGRVSAVAMIVAPYGKVWLGPIEQQGLPVVGLWTDVIQRRVDLDYRGMIERGTRCLLDHGRRRLALVGWGNQPLTRHFRCAMEAAGVQPRETWICTDVHPSLPGAGWAEFRELWMSCSEKPDGLLVLDDMLFDDIKTAILEMGIRVPDQLMLVTHANKGAGLTAPFPFAMAEFDPDECARHLGGMLVECLNKEPLESPVIVQGFAWCDPGADGAISPPAVAAEAVG